MRLQVFLVPFLFVSLFSGMDASGQPRFSNSIKISTGAFYIKDRYKNHSPFNQIGAYYERKLYKRWHIGTGYNQWKAWGREKFDKVRMIYEPSADRGDIKSREGYKMIDLYVYYKLPLVDDRHSLNIGIGPSRCWGDDIYLIDYVINPHPPYDIIFYEETRHKSRYGITNHLNYSFLVAKGRFQVGFDVRGRFYLDGTPAQLDYGIHLGGNF